MFDQVSVFLGILPFLSPLIVPLVDLLLGSPLRLALPQERFEGLFLLSLEAREKDGIAPGPEPVGKFNVSDQERPSC